MMFPVTYKLKDGTAVEVTPHAKGQKYIFDFFKNDIMFDSFTWAPAAAVGKEDLHSYENSKLEFRQREALEVFSKMKE